MGTAIAFLILACWAGHLAYALLDTSLGWTNPAAYFHLALQSYLTTGLFITAHDAMHGSVSRNKTLNAGIGYIACFCFAGFSYRRLLTNHRLHHAAPASASDPDFNVASQSFWRWLAAFAFRYATWLQLIIMAAIYNLFQHGFGISEARIWMMWMLPSLFGTLQLFYFGTYLPHRTARTELEATLMQPYHARTLTIKSLMLATPHGWARYRFIDHGWAMLSCYFFGYHWEHHHAPHRPWWMLWQERNAREATQPERLFSPQIEP
ncbi:MAG: fatty acid desaturase [Rhizobacter sp.]|nr:fatty acid desaturase [Chlorobiales bacterium]